MHFAGNQFQPKLGFGLYALLNSADGMLDLVDHASIADCMDGPGVAPGPNAPGMALEDCLRALDRDFDLDIDIEDFAGFACSFGS